MPPTVVLNTFEGKRITDSVSIPNHYIQGSSTRIQITSYLFENPDDINIEYGMFADYLIPIMTNSQFTETTENPWKKLDVFTLIRDKEGQEFTITFPPCLNIQMHHENFTNNKPLITWDSHPDAKNGYLVLVLVKDKDGTAFDNGTGYFALAYNAYTKETQVQMYSNRVTFTATSSTLEEIPPSLNKGDFIIIEVFALDGSGSLDMQAKKGAYFMDSTILYR